jgi:hypothetical protein
MSYRGVYSIPQPRVASHGRNSNSNLADNPADYLRSYLTQTRSELALRLCDRLYPAEQILGADGQPTGQLGPRATKPSKWWMAFQKRR